MSDRKRLYAIIFILVFSISLLPVDVLAQTTQEKADLLNKVSVLKGSSGGNYYLSNQLKRSEAAAFIIRLMGMEKHVLDNADSYKNTSFPDVPAGQWYATYVGYCSTNNIINGDSSGRFSPDAYISEKSFIKLVLCALGYEYNKDFTWNETYTLAYVTGIVTDYSYVGKADDNNNFTRSQAVDILFNALTEINQKTNKKMFYSLIDNGAITRETAVKAGLINDAVDTAIEDITVNDSKKISVKFSENIKDISASDVLIYETDDSTKTLTVKIDSQSGNEAVLETSTQKPGTEYTVTFTDVEDEEGNIYGTLTGTFDGYDLDVENVESDFFRINSIEALNDKAIKIYFTHPVNANSENAECYKIYEDNSVFADGVDNELTVKVLASKDNAVILTLNRGKFEPDAAYTLETAGELTSAYGVRMNDGEGDSMMFTASEEDAEAFALNEVIPYDNETLLLTFNKEINPTLAGQIYQFYITDEDKNPVKIEKTAIEAVGGRSGKDLFIKIEDTFDKDDKYYLTINNLNDITRQEYITEKTYTFEADYGSKDGMELDDINVLDSQTLEVSFSSPPDAAAATNAGYYSIRGIDLTYSSSPEKVYYDPKTDPHTVKLYLSGAKKLKKKKEYQLRIDDRMQDYRGNLIDSGSREEFDGTDEEMEAPEIESAAAISTDAVRLTFDREIALDIPNILPGNYSLEFEADGMGYKKVPLSVLYVDARTLVLRFDSLKYGVEYKIKYDSIKSYAGVETASTDDKDAYTSFMLIEE